MTRERSMTLAAACAIGFAAASLASNTASAAETCQGYICLDVRDDISNPVAVHFHLVYRSLRFSHFNYIHNGVQRETGGSGAASYRSPLLNVPRQPNNRISVQACNLGAFMVASKCTPWVQFSLPDLPSTAGPAKLGAPSGAAQAANSMFQREPGKSGVAAIKSLQGAPIPEQGVSPGSARLGPASTPPSQSSSQSAPPAPNPLHSGPATCKDGFVWRVAKPDDLVCVTPESRARVALENAGAAQNWKPGTRDCRADLVHRDAFRGDDVCVSKAIRNLVRQENRDGPGRRVQQ